MQDQTPLARRRACRFIQAGQLEQAVADHRAPDSAVDHPDVSCGTGITDMAARLFCLCRDHSPRVGAALAELRSALDALSFAEYPELTVKVPEGFQFYALFPEQYCEAASKWAADHADTRSKRALIVGLRSIGTSLSAVVAATLRGRGWETWRTTVRPSGHPFHRQVSLSSGLGVGQFEFGLVIDEGPGMSGSSMAAVAEALAAAGINRVYFFPGHNEPPGAAASPQVRHLWDQIPRRVCDLSQLYWQWQSLQQLLVHRAAAIFDCAPGLVHCADLGGGGWRSYAFPDESDGAARVGSNARQAPGENGCHRARLRSHAHRESVFPLGCGWPLYRMGPFNRALRCPSLPASRPRPCLRLTSADVLPPGVLRLSPGLLTLTESQTTEPEERRRLQNGLEYYRQKVANLLNVTGSRSPT